MGGKECWKKQQRTLCLSQGERNHRATEDHFR